MENPKNGGKLPKNVPWPIPPKEKYEKLLKNISNYPENAIMCNYSLIFPYFGGVGPERGLLCDISPIFF